MVPSTLHPPHFTRRFASLSVKNVFLKLSHANVSMKNIHRNRKRKRRYPSLALPAPRESHPRRDRSRAVTTVSTLSSLIPG